MRLSDLAIRRPIMAWMFMAALILFGGIAFSRMGVSQLPDVDYPEVSVDLRLVGAAPEVMETDVIDPVEDAVMGIEGVRKVRSISREGIGFIDVEFELNRNIESAAQDVSNKVAQAGYRLPKQMLPPEVSKTNAGDQPILWLTLSSERYTPREVMLFLRDRLKGQLSSIAGVGSITLGGYLEPNMRIWVSPEKLSRLDLTVHDIIKTLQNEHAEPPSGLLSLGEREMNVRFLGEASSVRDFGSMLVNARGGQQNYAPIPLTQVCDVEAGVEDTRCISRINGKPGLAIGIKKQRGSNAVKVAQAVTAKVAELQSSLPPGMILLETFNTTRHIEESISELIFTLLLSALLTALVCWGFLGSWSSTLNVILAIPTSVFGSFIVLYFSGFTLNTFTLLGLSLSIGIVVDDSIMVLENITRHREKGLSRMAAAQIGSREIAFAAIAASVAVVAIFLPVVFMDGIIGRFFFQFGITISVAIGLSLLEALTLTPMRCSRFLDSSERKTLIGRCIEECIRRLTAFYVGTLTRALEHRGKTMLAAFVFFLLTFYGASSLKKEFLPAQDQSAFDVRMEAPVGSSVAYTDKKTRLMEKVLSRRSEIATFTTAVGTFDGDEPNLSVAYVSLKPRGKRGTAPELQREASQQEVMEIVRKELLQIPDVKVSLTDTSTRGFSSGRGTPVEFTIQGPDWDQLGRLSAQVISAMEGTHQMTDINSNYLKGMPELSITPNRAEASRRGVSITDIAQTVNATLGGVIVGQFPENGHRYDIRVKMPDRPGDDEASRLNGLFVRNIRGERIPIMDLVKLKRRLTLRQIARQSRERSISIYANLAGNTSQDEALRTVETLSRTILPPSYHIVFGGGSESFRESFRSLLLALALGLIVAYMVLASQFNSLLDPITVLIALPFSLSGAFLALLFTHQSLNLYSMIGLVLLMGIVKKNSIMLVDFTNQIRNTGESSVQAALLKACPVRFRPILMTSLATIAGAIPPALAWGPGAESRIPMAVAIIGGVLVSTLLTLYVVPCVYYSLSRTVPHSPGDFEADVPHFEKPGIHVSPQPGAVM